MSELDGLDEARDDETTVSVLTVGNAALVRFMGSVLRAADTLFFIAGDRVQDLFGWGRESRSIAPEGVNIVLSGFRSRWTIPSR